MSSGENEYYQSLRSIRQQKEIDFDLIEIKNLPNKEAHRTLYEEIAKNASSYDYFVKVDGDMVFLQDKSLARMIGVIAANSSLDHVAFSVLDWYSQKAIIGMHLYSNRCRWGDLTDSVFVDPSPVIPGEKVLIWSSPAPVAIHSPCPDLSQAFQFGYHRCLKIVQRHRKCPDLNRSNFQYQLLRSVYDQHLIDGDDRRLAALYGACMALRSNKQAFESRDSFLEFQDSLADFDANKMIIERVVRGVWGYGRFRERYVINVPMFDIWFRWFVCSCYSRLKIV